MPMHDWRRVEPNVYHHFHEKWLNAIDKALNGGLLPAGMYSLVEQSTTDIVADVLTLEHLAAGRPPMNRAVRAGVRPAVQAGVGLVERGVSRPLTLLKRILVRHSTKHKVVAVIELVSPANKSTERDFSSFVGKAVGLVVAGISVLVIDPFPPGPRDPAGLHGVIWPRLARRRKGRPKYAPPAGLPLSVLAYSNQFDAVGDPEREAVVNPFAVGQPVPAGPLFLGEPGYVTVPLEETYAAAFDDVPAVWRDVVADDSALAR